MSVPVGFMVVEGARTSAHLLQDIGVGALIVAVGAGFGGLCFATPAILYAWAYRQVVDGRVPRRRF